MTAGRIGRRRVIRLVAAAGGLALGGPTLALAGRGRGMPAEIWRGTALGAEASIALYHWDRGEARRLLEEAVAELRRLEGVFSLHRPDSALRRLNREGRLAAPPLELVELLALARAFAELTDGAFDPTVQPLWRLYAGHFERPGADPDGPPAAAVAAARRLVDWRRLRIEGGEVAFGRRGMAVTLNGIAQGYVTDRVADLLERRGMRSVLVDLGEIRAIGRHPEGRPWRAGIRDPRTVDGLLRTVELDGRALATSAGAGTRFDAAGRFHHLFDPRTGDSADRYASVSVLAPRATVADALSTALFVMSDEEREVLRGRLDGVEAWILRTDGRQFRWRA